MSLRLLESLFSRGQVTGAALPMREYQDVLGDDQQRQRLERFLAACSHAQPPIRLPAGGALAMAVLAGGRGWQDQVFHTVLLPHLRNHLRAGKDLVGLVEPWLGPALGLPTREHVRVLARRCLLPTGSLKVQSAIVRTRLGRLIDLLDRVGWLGHNPIDLTTWPADECEMLARALPVWGDEAMVHALLTGLVSPARQRRADDLVRLLDRAAWVVDRAGREDRMQSALRKAFACLMYGTVAEKREFAGRALYRLMPWHARICRALRRNEPGDGRGEWYQRGADILPRFPANQQTSLKKAWLADVLLGWVSEPYGRSLVTALYRAWCVCQRAPPAGLAELTEAVIKLFRAADALVGDRPHSLIVPMLEEEIEKAPTGRAAAALVRSTGRMMVGPLPGPEATRWDRVKRRVLAWVLHETGPSPRDDAQGLAEWSNGAGDLERAAGRLAAELGDEATPEMCTLLWEVLLSPQTRHPWLQARLERAVNLQQARDSRPAWLVRAGELLCVLCAGRWPDRPEGGRG